MVKPINLKMIIIIKKTLNILFKFQVEGIVSEKIKTTIVKYRDNVDLQVLIDGVQQEVRLLNVILLIGHLPFFSI